MGAKGCKIEGRIDDQCRHASSSVGSRYSDTEDDSVPDPARGGERTQYLGGGHVLTLPSIGVADAVDEVVETARVAPHEVPCAIPAIARAEYISQHLGLRGFAIRIAFEASDASIRRVGNQSHRLARLVRRAALTESGTVAPGRSIVDIESQQCHRQPLCQERRYSPNCPRFAFTVVEREITLGRGVIFQDPRDAKPCPEFLPHVRAQPVTAG